MLSHYPLARYNNKREQGKIQKIATSAAGAVLPREARRPPRGTRAAHQDGIKEEELQRR